MNIFVGCSSRNTENEIYNRIAEEIGKFIVKEGHNFVFGGCDVVRQVEQFRKPMRCPIGIRTPLFVA